MTDTDAIRARHVRTSDPIPADDGTTVPDWCSYCETNSIEVDWPCDTAIVLAALDEERQGAETEGTAVALALGAKIVAAIEREARLRAALGAISTLTLGNEYGEAIVTAAGDIARAALATTHVGSEGTDSPASAPVEPTAEGE